MSLQGVGGQQPFLPELLPELLEVVERQGELALESQVKKQLVGMSASTIDRLLRPYRQHPAER